MTSKLALGLALALFATACGDVVITQRAPNETPSDSDDPKTTPADANPPPPTPPWECKEDGRPVANKPLSGVIQGKPFTLASSTGQVFNAFDPIPLSTFLLATTPQVCPVGAVVAIPTGVYVDLNVTHDLLKPGMKMSLFKPDPLDAIVGMKQSDADGNAHGFLSTCGRLEIHEVEADPATNDVVRVKLALRASLSAEDDVEGFADITYCR
jgi:hypothetical protein